MADQNNQNGYDGGLLGRIKESPRTVSALIIILIVAAAIYAFSGEPPQEQTTPENDEIALDAGGLLDETVEEKLTETGETSKPAVASEMVEAATQQAQQLPPAQRTAEGYTETAQPGDGITHLARRATTRWLAENQASYEITAEHRIYIEDYLQNKIGTEGLSLGETKTISFDLINEAVSAAQQLNERQLQHLGQYTYVLG